MDRSLRFQGMVALVTGASRGIGEASSLRFAREGADLALCANEECVFDVAEHAMESGVRAIASVTDVTDLVQVNAWFERVQHEYNRLDISVHNAGIMRISRLADTQEDDWDQVVDTH
jgi:NAD(P)-dependent dehydrogenase (short-subunit alcohol dehydrogenase family)